MFSNLRPDLSGIHLPTLILTLLAGWAGGIAASWLNLPLPMLLGSLLVVAAASIAGVRPLGRLPQFPQKLRQPFIPIIGVAIGGAFRPEIVEEAAKWWPSLVALALFIPAVHLMGFRALLAAGGTDRVTAFFGTAPGGLIEAVQMGEEAGADVPMLTMLQFLRLILTLVLVPIGFTVLTGHAVGSAGEMEMTGSDVPLMPRDVAILAACAVAGAWIGVRLHLPAGWIFGPIVLSGAVHLAGITETVPPGWLVAGVQVVIGTGLGVRFAGMAPGAILRALRLAVLNVAITIAGAAAVAFALGPLVGESAASVFLAFAPGGLIEMSLIALSLQVSVVYVTVHHIARILLAVTLARVMAPWLLKPGRD